MPSTLTASGSDHRNDIGRFLEDLRFEDVAPASSLDFAGSVDKRLEITMFVGIRNRLRPLARPCPR